VEDFRKGKLQGPEITKARKQERRCLGAVVTSDRRQLSKAARQEHDPKKFACLLQRHSTC
jgi:hypothetical protein